MTKLNANTILFGLKTRNCDTTKICGPTVDLTYFGINSCIDKFPEVLLHIRLKKCSCLIFQNLINVTYRSVLSAKIIVS